MMKPIIEIKNLSAGYDGRTVLHDVNLSIYERDFLGIIGPNGGGKTTLIKCILGVQIARHHLFPVEIGAAPFDFVHDSFILRKGLRQKHLPKTPTKVLPRNPSFSSVTCRNIAP